MTTPTQTRSRSRSRTTVQEKVVEAPQNKTTASGGLSNLLLLGGLFAGLAALSTTSEPTIKTLKQEEVDKLKTLAKKLKPEPTPQPAMQVSSWKTGPTSWTFTINPVTNRSILRGVDGPTIWEDYILTERRGDQVVFKVGTGYLEKTADNLEDFQHYLVERMTKIWASKLTRDHAIIVARNITAGLTNSLTQSEREAVQKKICGENTWTLLSRPDESEFFISGRSKGIKSWGDSLSLAPMRDGQLRVTSNRLLRYAKSWTDLKNIIIERMSKDFSEPVTVEEAKLVAGFWVQEISRNLNTEMSDMLDKGEKEQQKVAAMIPKARVEETSAGVWDVYYKDDTGKEIKTRIKQRMDGCVDIDNSFTPGGVGWSKINTREQLVTIMATKIKWTSERSLSNDEARRLASDWLATAQIQDFKLGNYISAMRT